jgi:hypothetical protein
MAPLATRVDLMKKIKKVAKKAAKAKSAPKKAAKKALKAAPKAKKPIKLVANASLKQAKTAKPLKPLKVAKEVVPVGKAQAKALKKGQAVAEGHCRYHYLALWRRNKVKAKILQGGKLDKYIEDLTAKYPDKYLEMLRKDLSSEKDFNLIVAEMDVEDSGDEAENEEEASRFIEEVRGGISTPDDDDGGF